MSSSPFSVAREGSAPVCNLIAMRPLGSFRVKSVSLRGWVAKDLSFGVQSQGLSCDVCTCCELHVSVVGAGHCRTSV